MEAFPLLLRGSGLPEATSMAILILTNRSVYMEFIVFSVSVAFSESLAT